MRVPATLHSAIPLFSPFRLFCLLFLFPAAAFSQLNMVLQDSIYYGVGVNDVCGWVAPDGKEYALVGLNTGVSIVDINTTPIQQVQFVPGVDNLWRDINTYSHYAYVSSEARVGLLIIDLQYLPDSVKTFIWEDELPTPNGPKAFQKAHTLWTDEIGRLYLNGSNLNNGGVVICDLTANPIDPVFLGYAPGIYSHDCYSRDSIIYSSEIYAGNLSIYDASDPANIVQRGQVHTPYEFTHNAWLSDNGQYMFTTDERANSFVTSYDISDPGNIIELDRYRQAATDGLGNIPHNVYVWNDWVVVAYYANGTIILDGSRPDNLVEVGNFDSFLGADGGFPGVWGSYPWLPSQKILASDRNNGLFVFIPNYVRACYLEGTVVDSVSHAPLNNALVTILTSEILYPQTTKPDGTFKMGKAIPGQYQVKVTCPGYFDKYVSFDFANGVVLNPVIEMKPFATYALTGKVIHEDSQTNVPFAKVIVVGNMGTYETTCDNLGNFILPEIFEGSYELQAGVWGYTYETHIDMTAPQTLILEVKRGYKDDFDLDLGWTVAGQVASGAWVRTIPGEEIFSNIWICGSDGDSQGDSGPYAYSTGYAATEDVEDSEVNGGTTWLSSPPMDLTNAIDPKITFDYWLCEFPPNQYNGLAVWLTNGMDTVLLDEYTNDTIAGSWQSKTYENLALQAPLDQIRFMISARDTTTATSFYILKVHLDNFELTSTPLATDGPGTSAGHLMLYPNPMTGDALYFTSLPSIEGTSIDIHISDLQGKLIHAEKMPGTDLAKGIHAELHEGLYLVQWITDTGIGGVEKLVVVKK